MHTAGFDPGVSNSDLPRSPNEMQYTFDSGDGFLEVKTSGEADYGTLARMIDDILAHPEWTPGHLLLVNHANLDPSKLTVLDVRSIAYIVSQKRESFGHARVAHLAAQDLQFGLVRMWEAFIADNWDASTRCFRSRNEAIAWLRENDER